MLLQLPFKTTLQLVFVGKKVIVKLMQNVQSFNSSKRYAMVNMIVSHQFA